MSQKASSLLRQNPFRRFINSIRERSKETKDGDLQDGSVVAIRMHSKELDDGKRRLLACSILTCSCGNGTLVS